MPENVAMSGGGGLKLVARVRVIRPRPLILSRTGGPWI